MKILNREQFLKLDHEVLFSKYAPCWFDSLQIKVETYGINDFIYQDIAESVDCEDSNEFVEILHNAAQDGNSFSINLDCTSRDGMFDEDQLFVVWDKEDVLKLIDRLIIVVKSMV